MRPLCHPQHLGISLSEGNTLCRQKKSYSLVHRIPL